MSISHPRRKTIVLNPWTVEEAAMWPTSIRPISENAGTPHASLTLTLVGLVLQTIWRLYFNKHHWLSFV